jgi:hypothetical protein
MPSPLTRRSQIGDRSYTASKEKLKIMERIENVYPSPGEVVVWGDAAGFAQQTAVGSHGHRV